MHSNRVKDFEWNKEKKHTEKVEEEEVVKKKHQLYEVIESVNWKEVAKLFVNRTARFI